MRHNDLICPLHVIASNYITAGCGWWENQGIDLETEPNWPADSIMVVNWPEHVISPQYNGDCTISGPYRDVNEAQECAAYGAELHPALA